MSDVTEPEVVSTLEDDSGAFCVDILRHADGQFTYVEYARDAADDDAWHPRSDVTPQTFKTEYAAYSAAMRDVEWLLERDHPAVPLCLTK